MSNVFLGEPPANIKQWIIDHYSQPSELGIPLYFEANEPGANVAMLAFDESMYEQTTLQCHLQYSTDSMQTWNTWDGSIVYLDQCQNNRVYLRADPSNPNTNGFFDHENQIQHYFKTDGSVKAGGNIQFLLESTGTRTDVPAYGFYQLFGHVSYNAEMSENVYDCASLTQAPALPATTLASRCYGSMFSNCASLTQAPALPATTLVDYCYDSMFSGCTSLTQAPALPATMLDGSCYSYMFSSCASLTQAPALPATTLTDYCYSYMFSGCTSLSSIDVSFSAWNPSDAAQNWVSDVASEGTFTCPSGLPQTTGNSNIPNGWTIVTK